MACAILAAVLIISLFVPVVYLRVDQYVQERRRKNHPKYFEYYDAAMKIYSEASSQMRKASKLFEYQIGLLADGLCDGECTNDYFNKRIIAKVTERYVMIAKQVRHQRQEADKLFTSANTYAKENNLKWGIIN